MTDTLPQRIEAAEGADRALDVAIALATGGVNAIGNDILWPSGFRLPCPRYTASIDAALTLVGDEFWRVEDHTLAGPCAVVGDSEAYAATPALALCAATLRAKDQANG